MKTTTALMCAGVALLLFGCADTPEAPGIATDTVILAPEARAQAALDRGDMTQAQQALAQLSAEAPGDYRRSLLTARYQQLSGQPQAAAQSYRQALALAPDNGTVMNNYGAFLCSLGQYVAAQQQFNAAARLPDDGWVAEAFFSAGICFLRADRPDDARRLFARALKADPQQGTRLLGEAAQTLQRGDRTDARLMLDVYNHILPVCADSLWLQIRFAALDGRQTNLQRYGKQLARNFPQSQQYQQFLANEY
ncbi:type IV pilus biogenesis/stability protein PilW [Edwardsiella ictaluri]|nr:type IV pilus biogenesis/stability protein PilW [Edwardsiella ictaluri]ARD39249.1 type IV pilus biogenesis/stability protein PilW [Edwardsiella ictaluri]AVZ82815.1 type IV pilus biogenesis/stability protein PilW [Edwardsiella ictaluri]EKS7762521.1 type IV pilus biogenesis/stability protein PilW [Edwardsiella ictaluri]EKS7770471.1 type IV pilus biogenesis/stability protein PilW [Edwardsiella ictaluri]EKS7773613.1 type IV pilus biogenesis/stability protein PilW [Edwardsiella ictaluri]